MALALTASELQTVMARENPTTSGYGQGCAGPADTPVIRANRAPSIGESGFAVELSGAEPGAPSFLLLGLLADANGILPFDLSSILGPGCQLECAPLVSGAVPTTSGRASVALPIPNVTGLLGAHLYAQFVILGSQGAATEGLDISLGQ